MGHHDVVNQQSFESGGAEQVKEDQKVFTEAFIKTAVVAAPLVLPGPEDIVIGGLALTKFGGAVMKMADDAVSGLKGMLKKGENISNPVPDEMARVIPDGDFEVTTLGKPGAKDVFVTDAKDIEGLNSAQVADRLTIPESESGFQIFTFKTPKEGLASPVNRSDPGFVGGGRTAGGAKEFVIPNQSIPEDAIKRVIKD